MGRGRHTPEQIITALREAEVGLASGKTAAMVGTVPGGTSGGLLPPEQSCTQSLTVQFCTPAFSSSKKFWTRINARGEPAFLLGVSFRGWLRSLRGAGDSMRYRI